MPKKWSEIANNPEFQALPTSERLGIQTQYFNDIVAPNFKPEEQDSVRYEFFNGSPTQDQAQQDLPQDVKLKNQFGELLGQAIRSTPLGANLTQADNYKSAFTNGLGPQVREALQVPEDQGGVMSEILSNPLGPVAGSIQTGAKLRQPDYAKNVGNTTAAEVVGGVTAPINYLIPPLIEAGLAKASLIKVGETTVGKLAQLPINRIKDAISGEVSPEVVDRFIRKVSTIKRLSKFFPDAVKNQTIGLKSQPDKALVNNPIEVFRASDTPFDKTKITDEGIWTNPEKWLVDTKSDNGRRVVEKLSIHPKAKILTFENTPKELYNLDKDGFYIARDHGDGIEIAKYAKAKGYDAVEYWSPKGLSADINVVNPEMISKPSIEIPGQKGESSPLYQQEPTEVNFGTNDRQTAKNIRESFTGAKNAQIIRGNQFSDIIKKLVPNELERQGMFWNKAAKGDLNLLDSLIKDDSFKEYRSQIKAAMNLSDKARSALQLVEKYYGEAAEASKELGTIRGALENYQNRIYAPKKKTDFIKTETQGKLRQTTRHGKQRYYETEIDAVKAGQKFATTDIADALSIYNEEITKVNHSRQIANQMIENGLATWSEAGKEPSGWIRVGELRNGTNSLYAPEGIAKGLRAIADPDWSKRIDLLKNLNRYQGIVKTVDLSYSFFHHFTLAMQTIYQGGTKSIAALLDTPNLNKILQMPDFMKLEIDFARHTGMTAKIESNQDVLRRLVQKEGWTNLPGVKQVLEGAQKNTEFLFGKVQRFLKVSDYGNKISNWIADHPTASSDQIKNAKMGFSKEINAAYGGLNWEAMGVDRATLSVMRLLLLAPDWTTSNLILGKYALNFTSGTPTAGSAARASIVTAVVTATVLTEGLNKILTGHFTNKNPKGHKLEVEIAPNVYVSFLRGGPGDIAKLGSQISESGAKGAFSFAQGRLAPILRTTVGALTNTQYGNVPITNDKSKILGSSQLGKTWDYLKYIALNTLPVPFSVATIARYLSKEERKSLIPGSLIAGGIARYSRPSGRTNRLSGLKKLSKLRGLS